MIEISQDIKNKFYEGSVPKELILTTNKDWLAEDDIEYQVDIENVNLYDGDAYVGSKYWTGYPNASANAKIRQLYNRYVVGNDFDYTQMNTSSLFQYKKYIGVSFNMYFDNMVSYPTKFRFCVDYIDKADIVRTAYTEYNVSDFIGISNAGVVGVVLPSVSNVASGANTIKLIYLSHTDPNTTLSGELHSSQMLIKLSDDPDTLISPEYVYTDWSETSIEECVPFTFLSNKDFISQQFTLTESLCSENNLKFGLCEASHCSGTIVNDDVNLKASPLYAALKVRSDNPDDILYTDLKRINWYKGTRNNYNPRTGSSIIRENTTRNEFLANEFGDIDIATYSDYFSKGSYISLKYKMNVEYFNTSDTMPVSIRPVMTYYLIDGSYFVGSYGKLYEFNDILNTDIDVKFDIKYASDTDRPVRNIYAIGFRLYDENGQLVSVTYDTKVTIKELQVHIVNDYTEKLPQFDITKCYVYNNTLDNYLHNHQNYAIYLGKFNVTEVKSRISYDLTQKSFTMYDNIVMLEQNAANWYTQYMFGIDTDGASHNGFEFARQIFSSFFNYIKSIGLDSLKNYDLTNVVTLTYDQCVADYMSTKEFTYHTGSRIDKLHYAKYTISSPNPDLLYEVEKINFDYCTMDDLFSYITDYTMYYDKLGRGLGDKCSILVEEVLSNNQYNRFAVDTSDLFMLSSDCQEVNVYVPVYATIDRNGEIDTRAIINKFSINSTPKKSYLANGATRLLYYNYNTKEIFACESNITGRDVVRSLLEPTGCFFRLSRKDSVPEFVYPTKSGLYPSETLYPANDLYPRAGANQLVSMGHYIQTIPEDYEVKTIGKIQILKNYTSSESESNVQWQYSRSEEGGLNTYIMDNNIFYCHSEMLYDYDNMPEVSRMLEIMYNHICNLNYYPHTTETVGMPWVECGDRLALITHRGGFETFVYHRTLRGIQALRDTYEAEGDEYIEGVKDYEYNLWEE